MSASMQFPQHADVGLLSDSAGKQRLRRRLLTWFDRHARDLPWRRSRDPYRVWVSEVMLQQTQVATVIGYFERFTERFPTIESLAAAEEQEVLRMWEGLGYYRRARQLHAAARRIVDEHHGQFPRDPAAVRALPGIGRYTAGAILSIAFDDAQPILEANTIRVISRLLAFRGDPAGTVGQRLLWKAAGDLLPRRRAGDFNQALMELGSEVCTPVMPRCEECPVRPHCPTSRLGLQALIPAPKKKTRYEAVTQAAVVIERRGKLLLRQCGPDERWAGLWDFPRFPLQTLDDKSRCAEMADGVLKLTGLAVQLGPRLTTIKHGVTRFRITLECFRASAVAGRLRRGEVAMHWVSPADLDSYPLNVTGRKIVQCLAVN